MTRRKIFPLSMVMFFLGTFLWGVLETSFVFAANPSVHWIKLNDDTINPITAQYISTSLDQAEGEQAQCLVLQLDTPGGLLASTRSIVKRILASKIPVVVYIAPSGSRAGSAGVFITYASHVAAMAPSTNIGAAHPVDIGGGSGRRDQQEDLWRDLKDFLEDEKKKRETLEKKAEKSEKKKEEVQSESASQEELQEDDDPMSSKILQDTVAFIRTLAVLRNRNVEWAIKSVTKSSSITEKEALELKVVELIAENEKDLLFQLDGRTVTIEGQEIILQTKDAVVKHMEMSARQIFFNILANPTIAYILMILGFYGLLYEVTHPGFGIPGVLGAIFLILALLSLQMLPTNYAGLALVILGLIFFAVEAFAPGLGLFVAAGVVCMILGSLLLFNSSIPAMQLPLSIIIAFTATTAFITVALVKLVLKAHTRKTISGQEGMMGEIGKVAVAIKSGKEGKVFVHGELWNATANDDIARGEKVKIVAVEGMIIKVKKVS